MARGKRHSRTWWQQRLQTWFSCGLSNRWYSKCKLVYCSIASFWRAFVLWRSYFGLFVVLPNILLGAANFDSWLLTDKSVQVVPILEFWPEVPKVPIYSAEKFCRDVPLIWISSESSDMVVGGKRRRTKGAWRSPKSLSKRCVLVLDFRYYSDSRLLYIECTSKFLALWFRHV